MTRVIYFTVISEHEAEEEIVEYDTTLEAFAAVEARLGPASHDSIVPNEMWNEYEGQVGWTSFVIKEV